MPILLEKQKRKYPQRSQDFRYQEIPLKKAMSKSKIEEDNFDDLRYHTEKAFKKIWDNDEDERWSQELLAAADRAGAVHESKRNLKK